MELNVACDHIAQEIVNYSLFCSMLLHIDPASLCSTRLSSINSVQFLFS